MIRRDFPRRARVAASATMTLAVFAGACTHREGSQPAPPEAPKATQEGSVAKAAPEAKPAEPQQVPANKATADLLAKIKPPVPAGAAPKAPTAEPKKPVPLEVDPSSLPSWEPVAGEILQALSAGDMARAEKQLLSEEELGQIVTPGYRDILAGSVGQQNRALLETYGKALKGKTLKHTLKGGPCTRSGSQGAFREGTVVMSNAVISSEADGVKIEVGIDQLLLVGGSWKVFRLKSP